MGIRKLKQKVAVALIAAMSVSNVLSAAAATTGTPSKANKEVTVTFDGNGGSWATSIASNSTASKSNTAEKVEEKEESTKITRTYLVGEEEQDDSGYFISLNLSNEYNSRGTDWKEVTREGFQRIAWFDGDEYLTDDSKKNLYQGAVLEAVWQAEDSVPEISTEVENILGESPVIITENLGEGEKLVLAAISIDQDKKCRDELGQVLTEQKIEVIGKLDDAVGIDISVEKDGVTIDKNGDKVTITLPVPTALSMEEDEACEIKAVHFKEGASGADIYPVKLNRAKTFMTFTADNGFSPFYFVKTKEAEKAIVTIENVPGGYIMAYTDPVGDGVDRIYLPIGEPVELEVGTPIYWSARTYNQGDYTTELKSAVIQYDNGETQELSDVFGRDKLKAGNSSIKAEFVVKEKESVRAPFYISRRILDDTDLRKGGNIRAEISVSKLNADNKYEPIDCKLELATKEELMEAGLQDYQVNDLAMDQFDFDPNTNILSSKGELEANDVYEVAFAIIYNDPEKGEQRYVAYPENPDAEKPYMRDYYVSFPLGIYMCYEVPMLLNDGKYSLNSSVYVGSERFAYEEGVTNWSNANPEESLYYGAREPKMHNYVFKGWMNEDGELYAEDSEIKGTGSTFYAYACFVSEDDETKMYAPLNADYSIFSDSNPDEENPDTPTNPGNSGSSSGSGSGSSSGSSSGSGSSSSGGSSTNRYSMTGTWVGDAVNGWKFVRSNGQNAVNTWGWINGQYYYFDAEGNMVTGWQFINGHWYYLNPTTIGIQGAMLTGVIFDPFYNAYFYADASGAMVTGWYQVGANWYYFSPVNDGVYVTGALVSGTYVDGYYLGADGAWVPGN